MITWEAGHVFEHDFPEAYEVEYSHKGGTYTTLPSYNRYSCRAAQSELFMFYENKC